MRILVITDVIWRNDNGVGNSYSNIFHGMRDVEIANICCQTGVSQNNVSSCCFQISESSLMANLKNRHTPSGKVERKTDDSDILITHESYILKKIKRSRLQLFFWIRDIIWSLGRWKSQELNAFIDEFKPDLIFAQVQDKMYQNKLVRYVQEYTKKPLMLYAWDDVYSMRQFSLSPLYWIDRLMQRYSIRKLVKQCNILYTISKEQAEEYARTLKKRTELLYKGRDFAESPEHGELTRPFKIIYTGNLYSGRYKTLVRLCKDLQEINKDGSKAVVDIYSGTPLSDKEISAINIRGTSTFCGKISEEEVQKLQSEADILLHIEPFTLKGSLLCRLSFSTKLVDYFHKRKCIFAVGSGVCSSMKYLKRYDAAVVAESYDEMREKLKDLINNPETVKEYADKAWNCGENNHRIEDIQNRLLKDFGEVINESCTD